MAAHAAFVAKELGDKTLWKLRSGLGRAQRRLAAAWATRAWYSARKSIGSIIKGGMPPSRTTSDTMRRTKGNSMCGAWISRIICWVPVSGILLSRNTPA